MVDSIEVRIRRLLAAQAAGVITADECQSQVEILAHRARLLHPIPLDEAVAKMAELARANVHSVLVNGRGAG